MAVMALTVKYPLLPPPATCACYNMAFYGRSSTAGGCPEAAESEDGSSGPGNHGARQRLPAGHPLPVHGEHLQARAVGDLPAPAEERQVEGQVSAASKNLLVLNAAGAFRQIWEHV